jgi:F-type H+-transporting ATPase subunit a
MTTTHSPFAQFEIKTLIDLNFLGLDISFSNSSLMMLIAASLIILFFWASLKNATIIPSRMQICSEMIFGFVENIIIETSGEEGKKFFPYIFSIFLFVIFCNLLGFLPYSFTVTSNIIITFAIAIAIFFSILAIGIYNHGIKYFSFLLPSGTPWLLAPLMIFIELFSYLSKPISLSVRLAANMIAGHVLIKVIAGFVVVLGLAWGFMPLPFVTLLIGFEFFVAMLQAYIFTILTCVYLSDAIKLH